MDNKAYFEIFFEAFIEANNREPTDAECENWLEYFECD